VTYLVSFSEDDLDLIRDALDLAARYTQWSPPEAVERFQRMHAELGELKARQDGA
jgi:hypothetical protein